MRARLWPTAVLPALLFVLMGPEVPKPGEQAPGQSVWAGWWGWWWWAVTGALILGALLYFSLTPGRRRHPLGQKE